MQATTTSHVEKTIGLIKKEKRKGDKMLACGAGGYMKKKNDGHQPREE